MPDFPCPVLIDTREQLPYGFANLAADAAAGGGPLTVTTELASLPTGDYSLADLTDRVCVERKSLADLFSTLGQGRDRFERELERMSSMDVAAIVVEASLADIIRNPPALSRMSPKAVYRTILAWTIRYPTVHWLPCGCRRLAEVTTFRFLEKFWQYSQRDNQPKVDGDPT